MTTTTVSASTGPAPASVPVADRGAPFADVLALLTMDPLDGALVEATIAIADGAPARAVMPVGLP